MHQFRVWKNSKPEHFRLPLPLTENPSISRPFRWILDFPAEPRLPQFFVPKGTEVSPFCHPTYRLPKFASLFVLKNGARATRATPKSPNANQKWKKYNI